MIGCFFCTYLSYSCGFFVIVQIGLYSIHLPLGIQIIDKTRIYEDILPTNKTWFLQKENVSTWSRVGNIINQNLVQTYLLRVQHWLKLNYLKPSLNQTQSNFSLEMLDKWGHHKATN